ncbi:TPA: hypothetical protein I8271_005052 [Kluyvera intermedia]|jgi:uncharacterized protein with von Willebrand factor type A (vWA) domain|uniref:Uncharacterized protein n=2 Tax=Enterobacteriaceae TaxID=543 RepID=A0AAC8QJD7_9ENTR|nr:MULTISPECIES: hypothetical protein [Enterobacterales]MCL5502095.1 hypothetical protein [Escherichia coli]MDU7134832.1 hypothetical protein [Enterobacteriaceae bacterium]HAT2207500.1 hypothetical protein [Kluyvera intermedia]HDT2444668.1 hypothetical protein [Klebsiella pneumoniae subsp. pneumoniae]AKL09930.1 hypothetical protein AB182_00805 [Phytobacter ursingii]
MKNVAQLQAALTAALNDPENDSEYARAQITMLLVEEVYKFVKFNRPGGEGLDGRDGQERQCLAKIVDAAKDYEFEVLERNN